MTSNTTSRAQGRADSSWPLRALNTARVGLAMDSGHRPSVDNGAPTARPRSTRRYSARRRRAWRRPTPHRRTSARGRRCSARGSAPTGCAPCGARVSRSTRVATPRSARSVAESAATAAAVATAPASRRPHGQPSWRSARPVPVRQASATPPRPRSGCDCGCGSNCTAHGRAWSTSSARVRCARAATLGCRTSSHRCTRSAEGCPNRRVAAGPRAVRSERRRGRMRQLGGC